MPLHLLTKLQNAKATWTEERVNHERENADETCSYMEEDTGAWVNTPYGDRLEREAPQMRQKNCGKRSSWPSARPSRGAKAPAPPPQGASAIIWTTPSTGWSQRTNPAMRTTFVRLFVTFWEREEMTKIEFDDAAIEAARKALLVPEGGGEMNLLDDEIHVLNSPLPSSNAALAALRKLKWRKIWPPPAMRLSAAEYHRIRQRPRAGRRPHRRAEADNTRLREELTAYTDAALYDALMSGPAFKGWNRSQLDRGSPHH